MSLLLDHRQLAVEMGIFCLDEKIGAGLPVWLPAGVALRDALEDMMRHFENMGGYQRVVSPHIGKRALYEMSGHLKAFSNGMFPPMRVSDDSDRLKAEDYFLRPMNCPHHHLIFGSQLRSYRQLPFRVAEFGQVYRMESSGSLRGLSRVRGLCQNDAHIYVNPSFAREELISVLKLHERVYKLLGLEGYFYRLSKHDPNLPDQFEGSVFDWVNAERILREALLELELPFVEESGEAAFYGPKIDVQMQIGVEEQAKYESIASVQLDFNSGRKFGLKFQDENGDSAVPWVIHRAPLGSHERIVSLLLERCQGHFSGWLAPIQLAVLPVELRHLDRARVLHQSLRSRGIRSELVHPNGSLSKRMKVLHRLRPFAKLVLGDAELMPIESEVLWRLDLREGSHQVRPAQIVPFLEGLIRPAWQE